jgi:GTPase SAR1 family protein
MTALQQKTREALRPTLDDAIRCVQGIDGFAAESARLSELRERVLSGRFHLAVLGQFKRGKSTLLNALIGQDILPTAIVPLTAVPTWVSAGQTPRVRVDFTGAPASQELADADAAKLSTFLSQFVTESGNPRNHLGVAKVQLHYPAPILAGGVVFIDTPGIGSTYRHNTETTLHFLPQCDAALFLVSADPPITETEIEFLRQVCPQVSRLFFVLNKTDYLSRADADEAVRFLRSVIVEQAGVRRDAPIFPVSARDGLRARTMGDGELWRASGMAAVEEYLVDFLAREKTEFLRIAVRHKAADVIDDIVMRLRLSLRAMQVPVEDLQSRLAIFNQKIEELHHEKQIAHDLLAGDKRRAHESLEERHKRICQSSQTRLNQVLEAALTTDPTEQSDESTLQGALDTVIPNLFDAQFRKVIHDFDARMREILQPHQQRLDGLVESIRKTAADLFEVPYRPLSRSSNLEQTREPYWVTYRWGHGFGPISPSVIDKLAPAPVRRRRLEHRFREKIEWLVLHNTGRLREALYEQIDKTFTQFRRDLDERLAATVLATQGAAKAAMEMRGARADAVADEVARLGAAVGTLNEITVRLKTLVGEPKVAYQSF